ncbi:MAG TPA: UvrD-helicase domain-containing protein [Methylotenera sp.]|nr:UvrD-helicase domain-containing protein [Methylotenera sp.]
MTAARELNLATDEKNRQRALDFASFIVEAPAGAGKTELLTQRYLKLLQTVNAPEEIIAITFTNKAAAEMRVRILDSLIKAANHEKPDAEHKQITYALSLKALEIAEKKQWQLIENPARLRIFTIDSLCAHLARQMPLMSRFGAQPRVAEDAGALYTQAAEHTLALLEVAAHTDVVKSALRYVDNNAEQLKSLLVKMLEKRDQWLHHAQQEVDEAALQQTLRHLVEQELASIAQVFNTRLQCELMPLARFAASQLPCEHSIALLRDWENTLPTHAEALPMWQSVRELLLTDVDGIRAGISKNIGFPPEFKIEKAQFKSFLEALESIPEVAPALAKTKKLPNIAHTQEAWQIISTFSQLLNLAVAQLWLVFQRAGEVDFVEIATRATQALKNDFGEPTDLALKLDYQIQHLLVDEFQDTSPSQIELLKQLTLGWQMNDQRTLFCVGDPMQSIYRFRKANVGLFIEAAKHGIGDIHLEKLQLYRNNRSYPAVVNWINQTFAKVFPVADDITQSAIQYRPFIATKEDATSAGVQVHPIIQRVDETNEAAQMREAEAVIEIILQARANEVQPKIAVLVRSKKHLAQLVSLIRRHYPEIAFQAVEIEALEGRQIVQDLLSLTHALHHRADRVHWLSVLRAPWCGLTLHDLHALAGYDLYASIWSLMQNEAVVQRLSADGQTRLTHVREIFAEAFATQGRMNTSRWLRGVWLMLNGSACLWEPRDVIDVQAFFACLDALDRSNQFSPERMNIEITKLFASPDAQGECLQMMTIHKSKGLEFDSVILPGLGATTGGSNSDKPLLLWEEVTIEEETQLLAAPYLPKNQRNHASVSPYEYLEMLENTREKNEAARVLYVAATRAERCLHLVGIANQKADDSIAPTKNTYLDLLWEELAAHYEVQAKRGDIANTAANTEADIALFTPRLVRLAMPQVPSMLQTQPTPGLANTQPNSATEKMQDDTQRLQADIGTLTHHYLELIAQHGLPAWPVTRLIALRPAMQHWLRQQGHREMPAASAADKSIAMLTTTLNSQAGQWVLQAHTLGAQELALTRVEKNTVKNWVVDRTFVETHADGTQTRWIIDYKTVELSADISVPALNTIALQYAEQLQHYAQLFTHEGLPIQKAIFFVSIGRLVPL